MPPRPDEPNQNITMSYMNNKGLWGFVGGMIAAAIGAKVVKSPVARKLAGLLIRRPRYRLLCGDCGFCMGACGRAVKEQARENGSGALSL